MRSPPLADSADYWLVVPLAATVKAYPGSSPFPGVVVFWTNRTSFANTFRVTAPVGFSSHAFWSLTLNETRDPIGTSVNVISYLSGGTACSGMPAKLRQLGWICVAPTPATHAWAEAGRSARRVVDPRNAIRTVATVD